MQRLPETYTTPNSKKREEISPTGKFPSLCKLLPVKSLSQFPPENPSKSRKVEISRKPLEKPQTENKKSSKSRVSHSKLPPIESLLTRSIKRFQNYSLPTSIMKEEMHEIRKKVPDFFYYSQTPIRLPRRPGLEDKKTIIFDLDETLVHASELPKDCHIILDVGKGQVMGVNFRPFLHDLLKFASREFEVIIFTASSKKYADSIIDHIDPLKILVHHRLYREHCSEFQGNFIKNLGRLTDRDLKDLVLVDNCLISFCLQLENGIPITSWYEDLNDIQLKLLIDYLKLLQVVPDVRSLNHQFFALK
jgi:CTD small phosphatase-like protein 2